MSTKKKKRTFMWMEGKKKRKSRDKKPFLESRKKGKRILQEKRGTG